MRAAAMAVASNHFFDIDRSCPVVAAGANAGAAHVPLLLTVQFPSRWHCTETSSNKLYTATECDYIGFRIK
jgi:hypothetical protein